MADTIVNGTELDTSILVYGTKKVNERGGSSMTVINKLTRSGLRLQTPMMLTWGANDFEDKVTGIKDGKFSMPLQFPDNEYTNPESEAFLMKMVEFENKIKIDAQSKSKDWFGKQMSAEVIDALYSPMLKYPYITGTKEIDYSRKPTLRLKIPMWENVFKCELYDEDGNILFPRADSTASPIDYLIKGTNVMCIIQCGGIWIADKGFGVTWKLLQAVIKKPRDTILGKGVSAIIMNSADKTKFNNVVPAMNEKEEEKSLEVVADSDDEKECEKDADVDTADPVAVAQVEVVKKVVRKVVKKASA